MSVTTKELIDLYYANRNPETVRKLRPQVDRPELYSFEERIGKQLIEMDVDELFQMLLSFSDNRRVGDNSYRISYASYDQIASQYRQIFDFYSDNFELIRNPWNDKRMRGSAAHERLARDKEAYTTQTMLNIIDKVRNFYDELHADYYELTILLFYCGFAEASEIATMKESDINFRQRTVRVMGRTIRLSERCFELLIKSHNIETMPGWRGDYLMASWQDSYFKFIIRPKEKENLDSRTLVQMTGKINQILLDAVKEKLNVEINYRTIYLLGFYDFMCRQVGHDRTVAILTSHREKEDVNLLKNLASMYGIDIDVSVLKRNLRPFVDTTE